VGAGPLDPDTEVSNAGIPARWRMPTDSLVTGNAQQDGDHYDPISRGVAACVGGAQHLRMPDHEPISN
jgi:hypothetical protein